jgi:hypothetical protein
LTINVHTSERLSLEHVQAFLDGSGEVGFKGQNREEVYGWVNQTLRQQRYEELKRSDRGVVRQYVEKMTGLSRAQTTRLITVYLGGDEVKPQAYRRRRFARRYTGEDIALLAGVDEVHETLSGPATKKAAPAGLLQLQRDALPEFGANLGGAVVPTSGESRAPRTAHQVSGDATDGLLTGAEQAS